MPSDVEPRNNPDRNLTAEDKYRMRECRYFLLLLFNISWIIAILMCIPFVPGIDVPNYDAEISSNGSNGSYRNYSTVPLGIARRSIDQNIKNCITCSVPESRSILKTIIPIFGYVSAVLCSIALCIKTCFMVELQRQAEIDAEAGNLTDVSTDIEDLF